MSWLPGGIREASSDRVERIAHGAIHLGADEVIRLAHSVLERFPEAKKRHMFIAGGAALSSALLIGAAVAITRRVRAGQNPQDAAADVTAEELEGVRLLERHRHRSTPAEPDAEAGEATDAADAGSA